MIPSSTPSTRSGTTITIAFGLLGALVAYGILRLVDLPWFDPTAFHAGVGVAALLGALSAWTVQRLGTVPRLDKVRWCLVPIAGAIVGMVVQAVPLRVPVNYQVISSGLTKAEPLSWILVGAPLGAIPAVAVMILLHLCLRAAAGRIPALDARERMIVPAAGTCLVLAAASFGLASPVEIPVVLGIVALASGALVEVVVRDLLRARWLGRAFQSSAEHSSFVIVPMRELAFTGELPSFIGGALSESDAADPDRSAAVVQVYGETAGYRGTARTPIALTCDTEVRALRPLRHRRAVAGAFVGAAAIIGAAFSLFST